MGQKVHPIGFRLGISQTHFSQWFVRPKDYSKYLFEDHFLRTTLQQRYGHLGLEKIEILRKLEDHIEILIVANKADLLVGKKGEDLKKFQQDIKKILKNYRQNQTNFQTHPKVALSVLGGSQTSASSVADFLIELLEKRVPYRLALNLFFKKRIQTDGIKIQLSGRLNGAEIARTEWVREGNLPLQTLQANIDYSCKQAQTLYGVLGIKVWIYSK
uniref:Small ribosomal subunit protein uS3c n=1 Tax=Pseudocodium devriesii TaxID=453070 RepID=A0A386B104_9CHLO|nr:ribosomal protein S3 [Pseudocodium devriesii]AYC65382.1 ribosomal protein S3 [Pseudocodium devriesii]